jgi:hypothetical protein
MAGATNRSLKSAGFKPAAIKVIRSTGGRGLSLRSAIGHAQQHGLAVPAKAVDRAGTGGAPEGWKRAARGEPTKPAQSAAAAEAQAKAKQEARAIYERGNAASGGKLAEMRSNIRQLTGRAREADERLRTAKNNAESAARKALGEPKKGPKAKQNRAEHERKLAEAVRNNPDVQRAAAERASVRAQLSSTLASRDATAKARKQQRGAESGGQMDLFGAPAPRAPSPFERRMALRDARAVKGAQALAANMLAARRTNALRSQRAQVAARSLGAASAAMMAARKAKATAPKSAAELIRNAEKKHLYGVSIASMREMARRSLVDAGTARAKLNAERAQLAKAEAAVGSARGRYEHGEATKRASMQRYHVQKAAEAYAKHLSAAKDTMRSVRKAEADLPPDVRAQVRDQRSPPAIVLPEAGPSVESSIPGRQGRKEAPDVLGGEGVHEDHRGPRARR